jgi:hypothetical protein
MPDTEDVLDFFETVALLVRKKAIDKKFAWHSFFYWLNGYRSLCKDYIDSAQGAPGESPRWKDILWLHKKLLKVERRHGGLLKCVHDLTEKEAKIAIEKFLKEEEELVID